jgi:hypothetical protein
MFSKVNWRSTIIAGAIAALLYCITAFIYIQQADYTQSWILFLGAGLFFFTMAIHTVKESRKRGGNESTVALVFESHVTTIVGIILSSVICFILLSILVPGYLEPGITDKVLANEPRDSIADKTNGLSFNVFIGATVLCFSGGSIAGITIPFYAKRNQTKDNREPVPLHQHGRKAPHRLY